MNNRIDTRSDEYRESEWWFPGSVITSMEPQVGDNFKNPDRWNRRDDGSLDRVSMRLFIPSPPSRLRRLRGWSSSQKPIRMGGFQSCRSH